MDICSRYGGRGPGAGCSGDAPKAGQGWSATAAELDLTWKPSTNKTQGTLTGKWQGFDVVVEGQHVGTFQERREQTCFRLTLKKKPGVSVISGDYDDGIETGDKEFDRQFLVEAPREAAALRVLEKNTRRKMLAFVNSHGALKLEDAQLSANVEGKLPDAEALKEVLDGLSTIARLMARHS